MTRYSTSRIREIYREVAKESDSKVEDVEEVLNATWQAVAKFVAEDRFNAIYLRHLGTFYGKEEIAYMIEKNKNKGKK